MAPRVVDHLSPPYAPIPTPRHGLHSPTPRACCCLYFLVQSGKSQESASDQAQVPEAAPAGRRTTPPSALVPRTPSPQARPTSSPGRRNSPSVTTPVVGQAGDSTERKVWRASRCLPQPRTLGTHTLAPMHMYLCTRHVLRLVSFSGVFVFVRSIAQLDVLHRYCGVPIPWARS
jgi:hypothetical protein